MPKSRDAWLVRDSRLLAKLTMTEARLEALETTGVFNEVFSREKPASEVVSPDGAVLVLGASGQIVGLRLTDYVDPEYDREIVFEIATVMLRFREDALYVTASHAAPSFDPWSAPPGPGRSGG
jgi:hypothetical protein